MPKNKIKKNKKKLSIMLKRHHNGEKQYEGGKNCEGNAYR